MCVLLFCLIIKGQRVRKWLAIIADVCLLTGLGGQMNSCIQANNRKL